MKEFKYYSIISNKKFTILIICFFLIFLTYFLKYKLKKKVGIIGLEHSQNVGNNLLKYAIYIKLLELGYDPYIVGKIYPKHNISFLLNTIKVRIINKSFTEIKKNDYDILMVNSDQTWRNYKNKYVYDIAFLKFAKFWNISKLVYAASLGIDKWEFNKKDEEIAKSLLKDFNGISVREKSSVKLVEQHLGLKPSFVLDPTFLIDKKYYLNLIKNYKNDVIIDKNYIFIYTVSNSIKLKRFVKSVSNKYKIYQININVQNQIQKFLYGIYKCKAVITDSFHGTVFSLIFNKPFISFVYRSRGNARFNTLKDIFHLKNRIFDENFIPDLNQLEIPLNLNKSILNSLKKQSINFLKKNLYI